MEEISILNIIGLLFGAKAEVCSWIYLNLIHVVYETLKTFVSY